jgi:hypothetical protein
MADVKFRMGEVLRHSGAMAERAAVVRPLSRTKDMSKDNVVEAGVKKVLDVWRRRCNLLRELGLPVLQGVRFQYARNCPPVAVKCRAVGRHVYPCQLSTLCPWCWARKVVKPTYDRVYRAMTALSTLGTGEDPYKLVLAVRAGRMPDDDLQPGLMFDMVNGVMDRTKRALKVKRAVGAVMLSAIHPGKKDTNTWVYGTRMLALVPQDYEMPPGSVAAPPTKRGVAQLVGRFARYPAGLMFGEADFVVRLMAVRGRHRLLRTSGVFRGSATEGDAGADEDHRHLDL